MDLHDIWQENKRWILGVVATGGAGWKSIVNVNDLMPSRSSVCGTSSAPMMSSWSRNLRLNSR